MNEARKELDQRIKSIDSDIAYLTKQAEEAEEKARSDRQRIDGYAILRAQYVRIKEAAESL